MHAQRIAGGGCANGASERSVAELYRQLAVRARLAVWNAPQQAPDALLKRVAARSKRKIEFNAFAPKVLTELLDCRFESGVDAWSENLTIRKMCMRREVHPREHALARDESKLAQR